MFANQSKQFNSFASILSVLFLVAMSGCNENVDEKGTDRDSPFEPIVHDRSESLPSVKKPPGDSAAFAFVHANAILVARLSPAITIDNPLLGSADWAEIESLAASILGKENAHLEQISQLWVVVSREILNQPDEKPRGNNSNPNESSPKKEPKPATPPSQFLTLVVDFTSTPDRTAIENAISQLPEHASWQVEFLEENRVLFGNKEIIQEIADGNNGNVDLIAEIKKWPTDIDCVGSFAPKLIRTEIRSMLEGQNGRNQPNAKFADQIDSIQSVSWKLDLKNETLIRVTVSVEDPSMAKECQKGIKETFDNLRSMSPLFSSMLKGMKFNAAKLATDAIQEVFEQDLFQAQAKKNQVVLQLKKTSNFDAMILALVKDLNAATKPSETPTSENEQENQ